MPLILNEKQTSKIATFISDAECNPDMELEFRFSTFLKDNLYSFNSTASTHRPKDYRFVPIIEPTFWHDMCNYFFSLKEFDVEHTRTVEEIYGGNIRKIENLDDSKIVWNYKEKVETMDIFDYNFRVSLSRDYNISKPKDVSNLQLTRRKTRTTFRKDFFQFDFTCVITNQGQSLEKKSFEIELEFLPRKHIKVDVLHEILCNVQFMLSAIQDTHDLITIQEQHNVLLEYNVLLNCRNSTSGKIYFPGAQPETLHNRDISKIKNGWSLTEKLDGERGNLFVDQRGKVFLIDRRLRVRSTSMCHSLKGVVLDVEKVKLNFQDNYFLFDVLVWRGKDIRGDNGFLLKKRLALLEDFIKVDNPGQRMILKKFYFKDF